MYISPISVGSNLLRTSLIKERNENSEKVNTRNYSGKNLLMRNYITFCAQQNRRSYDTEKETQKLLRQFDDILISGMDQEESKQVYEIKMLAKRLSNIQKLEALNDELINIESSPFYNELEKAELANQIKQKQKAVSADNKKCSKPYVPMVPVDKNIDLILVNKFKTAILEDNFNLDKVYLKYYSKLNEIKKVEDLKKEYPQIKLPLKAEDVISDKIISVLTRDFYETLDRKMKRGNVEDIFNYCDQNIKNILNQSVNNPKEIYEKILEPAVTKMLDKRENLNRTNFYSSIPQYRKNQNAKISENDLKLLSVDYDDFVMSVLRQQYLDRKKPYEIEYTDGKTTINISLLKENAYKFEKPSERIKTIINTAKEIQSAKRDYENFDVEDIKKCLDNWAGQDIGNNEDIFDRIVMFDSCRFADGDKKSIIRFLRILDSVKDGDIPEVEALKMIKSEDLRPLETEQINKIEKQKRAEALKNQQKEALRLKYLRFEFDKTMELLYQNDMGGLAVTCAKYRPTNMEVASVENAEFIISSVSDKNLKNKDYLKKLIKNWDAYNYFKANNPDSEILKKAEKYARQNNDKIDVIKAGIYISNILTVSNAPESLEGQENKDFIQEIIEHSASETDAAEGLCKYNEYKDLNSFEKSHLQEFMDIFDIKNPTDKFILKRIIESDYVNNDTVSQVILNDNDKTEATISANAKRQILEKYKFPKCLEFMLGFEKVLTTICGEKGASGIKKITKNNKALEYKMELKLVNHDDRIFASKEDYYFDVFSDRGLH